MIRVSISALAKVLMIGAVIPSFAHEDRAPKLEEIVVYGRAEQAIGVTMSASEGMVGTMTFNWPRCCVSAGEDGYYRGLIASSVGLSGGGWVTGALDITRYDGPWDLEDNLEQSKLYLSYFTMFGGAQAKFTMQGYTGNT